MLRGKTFFFPWTSNRCWKLITSLQEIKKNPNFSIKVLLRYHFFLLQITDEMFTEQHGMCPNMRERERGRGRGRGGERERRELENLLRWMNGSIEEDIYCSARILYE